jgi:hypothetical protein
MERFFKTVSLMLNLDLLLLVTRQVWEVTFMSRALLVSGFKKAGTFFSMDFNRSPNKWAGEC